MTTTEWKIVEEQFNSLDHLLSVLDKRENNAIMHDCKSSNNPDADNWYGTRNYKAAVKLMREGYTEVVERMSKNVKDATKINSKIYADVAHPIPHNHVYGYVPNVPNALRGLPQSMITIDRKPMKRKTLEILYCMSGLADRDRAYFEKAGTAMLSAINLIELSGVQCKLTVAFKASHEHNEATMPTVCIKNYGERFSVQKVAFPLVHTSMFRRFGFKWLETAPGITDRAFNTGYGVSLTAEECEEVFSQMNRPGVVIGNAWINDHCNDVNEILKKLGVV